MHGTEATLITQQSVQLFSINFVPPSPDLSSKHLAGPSSVVFRVGRSCWSWSMENPSNFSES